MPVAVPSTRVRPRAAEVRAGGGSSEDAHSVLVYSKEGCGRCQKAKEKLGLLGFVYESRDIEKATAYRPGWREDGSIELMAALAMADGHPPVVWIPPPAGEVGGKYHGYSRAMLALKELRADAKKQGDELSPPGRDGEKVH